MIGRAGYDLLRAGLRVAVQLWPLWLFWYAWNLAYGWWSDYLLTFPSSQSGVTWTTGYAAAVAAWPTVALLGPALVMGGGVFLHRTRAGSRADEAFVIMRGSPPLRCGHAIYFRRPEWDGLVGDNRFHRGGQGNRDAAE